MIAEYTRIGLQRPIMANKLLERESPKEDRRNSPELSDTSITGFKSLLRCLHPCCALGDQGRRLGQDSGVRWWWIRL
jgi:hypothetical protein